MPNSDGSIPEPQRPNYDVIPDTYKLTLNPGNGTVSPKDKTVTYKKPYGELPTPLRTGYDFGGWFTESGGNGEEVTSETIMMKLYDHTLYAKWTPKVFTVKFNPNTGTIGTPTKKVTYDETYGELPVPTKPGYDFVGWYTAANGGNRITDKTVVQILADQELFAHWTPKTYQVAFNSNGCGSITNTTKNVSYDSSFGPLGNSSRANYTFNGWYTAPTGGTKVNSNTKATGENWIKAQTGEPAVTLYAQCTYNPPPPTPPYNPPSNRPSNSGSNSGSSSTNNKCTITCSGTCGTLTQQANACSNEYNELANAGKLDKEKADELHQTAMEKRAEAAGATNPDCSSGTACYDGVTGEKVTQWHPSGGTTNEKTGEWMNNVSTKGEYTGSGITGNKPLV